jgi:hypothetical protein
MIRTASLRTSRYFHEKSVLALKVPFRLHRVSEGHRWSNPVRAPRVDIAPVFRNVGRS